MKVLSFFSDYRDLVKMFENFINNYSEITMSGENFDTKYYTGILSGRNEIYFHYVLDDIDHEFSYNYTEEEQRIIKDYFKNSAFYLFDIQYREESFLNILLLDFEQYLNNTKNIIKPKVLLNHYSKGIVTLEIWNIQDQVF